MFVQDLWLYQAEFPLHFPGTNSPVVCNVMASVWGEAESQLRIDTIKDVPLLRVNVNHPRSALHNKTHIDN